MRVYAGFCSREFAPPPPDLVRRLGALSPSYKVVTHGPLLLLHDEAPPALLSREGVVVCGDLPAHDAEMALHHYLARGGWSFLDLLNGEFSVVVIDANRRSIAFATDRIGLAPLYYAEPGGDFVWSSVPSLIAQHPDYRFAGDQLGIAQFLFGTDHTDGRTFYRGISHLLPATVRVVTPEHGRSHTYWTPGSRTADFSGFAEAAEALRELLTASIKARHRNGATGVLLSGGIDSSSVTCLAAEAGLDVRTYSLVFSDAAADERDLINLVVQKYGLAHSRIEVPSQIPVGISLRSRGGAPDLLYVPNIQMHAPQLEQMRGDGLAVSLDGLGGDQLFGAAPPKRSDIRRSMLSPLMPRIVRFVRRRLEPRSLLHAMRWDFALRQRAWRLMEPAHLPRGVTDSVLGSASLRRSIEQMALLGHQFGIETYSPLLDAEVVDFVASLPRNLAFSPAVSKSILREAVRGIVPEAIRTRTAKAHYAEWFDHDLGHRQRETVRELLSRQGPVDGLLTKQGRSRALQYLVNEADTAGRWICSNWLAVQQWWSLASQGDFYVRERAAERRKEEALAEAGAQVLG